MSTLYDTLGVASDADAPSLKRAFRAKAKNVHPDKTGGDPKPFQELNRAYALLSDPAKREEYDKYGDAAAQPETLQQQAEKQLCELVVGIAQSVADPTTENVLHAAHNNIEAGRKKMSLNVCAAMDQADRMAAVLERLSRKDGTENPLHFALEAAATGLREQCKAVQHKIDVGAEMLRLLDGYRYRVDEPPLRQYTAQMRDIDRLMASFRNE
jgi:curved DNA-binding protein CbpA